MSLQINVSGENQSQIDKEVSISNLNVFNGNI